ncbi:hypothetical protein PF008_g26094 [Phytophthora fragariae]|uniref:RxLR effector protein n=1 Tax=Phytophthora fragariae TaxID=53985 RepID=A0A6G0QIZ8_9STRA|nr:hypothetical protein PF008_g26094 [Phytophthora fragariae]
MQFWADLGSVNSTVLLLSSLVFAKSVQSTGRFRRVKHTAAGSSAMAPLDAAVHTDTLRHRRLRFRHQLSSATLRGKSSMCPASNQDFAK